MNETWVKLYRKLNDNELILDEKALKVFIWLLLNADKDGRRRISKYRTSEAIKMNAETFIKVLKRLKNKYGVIHSIATSKYTEIRLLNWEKYQSKDSTAPAQHQLSTSSAPAQHLPSTQPSTTSTRIRIENKNREERETASIQYLKNIPLDDVKELTIITTASEKQIKDKGLTLFDYCKAKGKIYKDYKAFLRNAVRSDYPRHDKIELLADLIPSL